MTLTQSLKSSLTVMPDERVPVAVLFGQAFCLGLARLLFQTAGSALLLLNIGASALPYVYVVAGVAVPVLGLVYAWLEARLAFRTMLLLNVGGLLCGALFFSFSLWGGSTVPWLSFGIAVFSDVVWALTGLALWPLTGRLFTVRQSKRLFGFINAGDVLAAICGGLATPLISSAFGIKGLLFVAAGGLAVALGLVLLITRRYQTRLGLEVEAQGPERASALPSAPRGYLLLIVALAALAYAAFFFTSNSFYTLLDATFTREAELVNFLGPFWAIVYVLTLLSNVFIVGPVMGRLGLRTGLLLLPVITFAITGAMLVNSLLPGAAVWLFSLATLNYLANWVLSETIYKSGLLVLYQPLPVRARVWAQTSVETIGQPLAQATVGLALIGLNWLAFGVREIIVILFGLLAGQLMLTWYTAKQYIGALTHALAQRRFRNSHFAPPDQASLKLLQENLNSPYPGVLLYALDTLEEMNHPSLIDGLAHALKHAVPEVRREAIRRIERLRLNSLAGEVRGQLAGEADPLTKGRLVQGLAALAGADTDVQTWLDDSQEVVRAGALVGLLKHGQLDSVLAAGTQLYRLLGSPLANERLMAARIIGEVGAPSLQQSLTSLLHDADVQVRGAALEAAGRMAHPKLFPLILEALNEPATRPAAGRALVLAGEAALPSMAQALASNEYGPAAQARLIACVSRQMGAEATVILRHQLQAADGERQSQVLHGLVQRRYRPSAEERTLLEQDVLTAVREAAQLLMVAEELRSVGPRAEDNHPFCLEPALLEAAEHRRERVFLALALLFEPETIGRVRDSLWRSTVEQHAYALEVLEHLLPKQLQLPVLALVENARPAERRAKLGAVFDLEALSPAERLRAIVLNPQRLYSVWVRCCAVYALAPSTSESISALRPLAEAERNPVLREIARWALGLEHQPHPQIKAGGQMLSLVEKIVILKSVSIFAETPPSVLSEVARLLEEVELPAEQRLFTKGEPGRSLYLIVNGRVRVHDAEHTINTLGPRTIVGEMAVLDLEPRLASVTAVEDTLLLRLDQEALYELMSDRVEVARGIIRVLSARLRNTVAELTQTR